MKEFQPELQLTVFWIMMFDKLMQQKQLSVPLLSKKFSFNVSLNPVTFKALLWAGQIVSVCTRRIS